MKYNKEEIGINVGGTGRGGFLFILIPTTDMYKNLPM